MTMADLKYFTGVLDPEDSAHDDFELWSPAEGRTEACLFGRKVRGAARNNGRYLLTFR